MLLGPFETESPNGLFEHVSDLHGYIDGTTSILGKQVVKVPEMLVDVFEQIGLQAVENLEQADDFVQESHLADSL